MGSKKPIAFMVWVRATHHSMMHPHRRVRKKTTMTMFTTELQVCEPTGVQDRARALWVKPTSLCVSWLYSSGWLGSWRISAPDSAPTSPTKISPKCFNIQCQGRDYSMQAFRFQAYLRSIRQNPPVCTKCPGCLRNWMWLGSVCKCSKHLRGFHPACALQ